MYIIVYICWYWRHFSSKLFFVFLDRLENEIYSVTIYTLQKHIMRKFYNFIEHEETNQYINIMCVIVLVYCSNKWLVISYKLVVLNI